MWLSMLVVVVGGCRREAFISVIGPLLAIGCPMKSRTCHLEAATNDQRPHRITNHSSGAARSHTASAPSNSDRICVPHTINCRRIWRCTVNWHFDQSIRRHGNGRGQIPRVPNGRWHVRLRFFLGPNDSRRTRMATLTAAARCCSR